MKRIILFTILAMAFLAPGIMKAQLDVIPNGNFSSWTTVGTKTVPAGGWVVLSGAADSVSSVDYTKDGGLISRPTYDGKHCLSLACGGTGGSPTLGVIAIKMPMTHLDPFLVINFAYIQGGNSPNFPAVVMKAWHTGGSGGAADTCLKTSFGSQAGTSVLFEPWATLNLPLSSAYTSTTAPDSLIMYIYNQSFAPLDPGTVLFIENMYFSANAGAGINATELSKNGIMAYPNPFTNTTTIHYNLGVSSLVNLSVFDMQGRAISNLVNENQIAGAHDATFNGDGLKNGVYFYRLQTGAGVETGKLILNK